MQHDPLTTAADPTTLIKAIAGKDETAIRLLIRRFRPLVFRTALKMVCDTAEAEDITQEVFIRVWKNAGRFDGKYSVTTWLYKITFNMATDQLRKKRPAPLSRQRDGTEDRNRHESFSPSEKSSEEKMIAAEDWRIFKKASERLTPKQRIIFTLKEIEELDTSRVAEITGMTPEQIKSNLYLARKAMREALSHWRKI